MADKSIDIGAAIEKLADALVSGLGVNTTQLEAHVAELDKQFEILANIEPQDVPELDTQEIVSRVQDELRLTVDDQVRDIISGTTVHDVCWFEDEVETIVTQCIDDAFADAEIDVQDITATIRR